MFKDAHHPFVPFQEQAYDEATGCSLFAVTQQSGTQAGSDRSYGVERSDRNCQGDDASSRDAGDEGVWVALILAIFVPLAVHRYKKAISQ